MLDKIAIIRYNSIYDGRCKREIIQKGGVNMVDLYFRPSIGDDRKIAICKDGSDIIHAINIFINKCNDKNRENGLKEFKSYYIRSWTEEDGTTWYDVGSHSEFFYTKETDNGNS